MILCCLNKHFLVQQTNTRKGENEEEKANFTATDEQNQTLVATDTHCWANDKLILIYSDSFNSIQFNLIHGFCPRRKVIAQKGIPSNNLLFITAVINYIHAYFALRTLNFTFKQFGNSSIWIFECIVHGNLKTIRWLIYCKQNVYSILTLIYRSSSWWWKIQGIVLFSSFHLENRPIRRQFCRLTRLFFHHWISIGNQKKRDFHSKIDGETTKWKSMRCKLKIIRL